MLALALLGAAEARGAVAVGIQGWSLPTERSLEAVADGGMRDFRVVFDWSDIGAGPQRLRRGRHTTR